MLTEELAEIPAPNEMTEAEMIAGSRAGNRAALNALAKRYQPAVLRICVSLLGSRDVDDLVQEIFIKILRRLNTFEGRSSLFTWIYEIAVNQCRDELRRRKRRRWFSLQALPEETVERVFAEEEGVSAQLEASELRNNLHRELKQLDQKYRELVVLRDLEGLGYDEIAKISGIDEKLVKSRLYQARQILAAKMKKYAERFYA